MIINLFFSRHGMQQQHHGAQHPGPTRGQVQLPEQAASGAAVQDRCPGRRHLFRQLRQGGLAPEVRQHLRRQHHGLRDGRGDHQDQEKFAQRQVNFFC